MQVGRLIRHAAATHWRTRRLFPASTLDAIERAIARADAAHEGEIRFAVETALTPLHIWHGVAPRERALAVFGELRVWDTELNNGVLIYVQLADRSVEIVADRGLQRRVSQAEWEAVCRLMEEHYRAGRFELGSIAGVEAVGALLARHFPPDASQPAGGHNQLPERPTLL
jgi:uncharacterized membrane protein